MTKIISRYWYIVVVLVILVRLVNVENTARFTHDESSDLLHLEQLWQTKKITLIGPISTDNSKVFGSLTYYMLLPFTVLTNFDPIGPVYGTIFWGILTAGLLILITRKVNKSLLAPAIVLAIVWYPLLESSRWAWNPHLVIFWIFLGLIISLFANNKLLFFAAGFCMGLAIHNHFIALPATVVWMLIYMYRQMKSTRNFSALAVLFGYIMAILPFFIFDWLHPPGIFIGRFFSGQPIPHVVDNSSLTIFIIRAANSLYIAFYTVARQPILAGLIALLTVWLVIKDWINSRRNLWLLLPVVVQILIGLGLVNYEVRYFLPALPFFFMWLIQPRPKKTLYAQQLLIWGLVLVSMITLIPQLTRPESQPPIRIIRGVVEIIDEVYDDNDIINVNVTTVASPDSDLLAMKYRDVLALYHIPLKAASEYDTSEHLFVVSTAEEAAVRADASVPLKIFSEARLRQVIPIENSPWKVYWLSY